MYEGRLVRLRAFEQGDVDANHAFINNITITDYHSEPRSDAPPDN